MNSFFPPCALLSRAAEWRGCTVQTGMLTWDLGRLTQVFHRIASNFPQSSIYILFNVMWNFFFTVNIAIALRDMSSELWWTSTYYDMRHTSAHGAEEGNIRGAAELILMCSKCAEQPIVQGEKGWKSWPRHDNISSLQIVRIPINRLAMMLRKRYPARQICLPVLP